MTRVSKAIAAATVPGPLASLEAVKPASSGKPAPKPVSAPKPDTRTVVTDAVQKALDGVAALALSTDRKIASLQVKLATTLYDTRKRYFMDKGGAALKLIFHDSITGKDRELGFYDWAMEACKLNRSSLGNYIDTGEFLRDHPEARDKVGTLQAGVVLKRAERRKPDAIGKIVAAIKPGDDVTAVESAALKLAPKPVKKATRASTSKELTALEGKLRDKVWGKLASLESEEPHVARVTFGIACINWALDKKLGNGRALTAKAVEKLAAEYHRNLDK